MPFSPPNIELEAIARTPVEASREVNCAYFGNIGRNSGGFLLPIFFVDQPKDQPGRPWSRTSLAGPGAGPAQQALEQDQPGRPWSRTHLVPTGAGREGRQMGCTWGCRRAGRSRCSTATSNLDKVSGVNGQVSGVMCQR